MGINKFRRQVKELVIEGALAEEAGPHNRKIYRKLSQFS